MKTIKFYVDFPGDSSAGMLSCNDDLTISCDSGDFGGEPGEFAAYIQESLGEWYDGASVTLMHDWEPMREISGNTGYDVLYKCTHCGSIHTESLDDIDSILPLGPCPGHKEKKE